MRGPCAKKLSRRGKHTLIKLKENPVSPYPSDQKSKAINKICKMVWPNEEVVHWLLTR